MAEAVGALSFPSCMASARGGFFWKRETIGRPPPKRCDQRFLEDFFCGGVWACSFPLFKKPMTQGFPTCIQPLLDSQGDHSHQMTFRGMMFKGIVEG